MQHKLGKLGLVWMAWAGGPTLAMPPGEWVVKRIVPRNHLNDVLAVTPFESAMSMHTIELSIKEEQKSSVWTESRSGFRDGLVDASISEHEAANNA